MAEVNGQQIEVDRVDATAVVEIALAPDLAAVAKIGGQQIEVDGVERGPKG